ncbi:MAG: hypothetical protein ACT4N1_07385 [Nitrososphaerota archaeon]
MTKSTTAFAMMGIIILGTTTSFAFAFAAPQPNGQPFQALQAQIDARLQK